MDKNMSLLVPDTDAWRDLAVAAQDTLAQLMPNSRRVYRLDFKAFLLWMADHDLTPATLTRSAMIAYQAELLERYERATAARMIASVRSMLQEWSLATGRANPAAGLRPIKVANETTHVALSKPKARLLLKCIDTSTVAGLRDYAIVALLLRTGIRRAECAALTVGDLEIRDSHHIAVIRHGKEDKRRIIKIPPDVFKAIERYMEAAWRTNVAPSAPLFVQIRRGGHVQTLGLGTKAIERLVKSLGEQIGETKLRPHGLRATFVTLTLESGAPLQMVQYAAGHSKPETTERYQKRKQNLDHNAVDYLHDLQA